MGANDTPDSHLHIGTYTYTKLLTPWVKPTVSIHHVPEATSASQQRAVSFLQLPHETTSGNLRIL